MCKADAKTIIHPCCLDMTLYGIFASITKWASFVLTLNTAVLIGGYVSNMQASTKIAKLIFVP